MIVKNLARVGERFDGRGLEEARGPVVERMSNSCLVSMGRSRLLAAFQKSVVRPYIDKPHEGLVSFSMSGGSRRHEKVLGFLHKVYIILLRAMVAMGKTNLQSIDCDVRVLRSLISIFDSELLSLAPNAPSPLGMLMLSITLVRTNFR